MPRHSYCGKRTMSLQTQGRIAGCGLQQGLRKVNSLLDSKLCLGKEIQMGMLMVLTSLLLGGSLVHRIKVKCQRKDQEARVGKYPRGYISDMAGSGAHAHKFCPKRILLDLCIHPAAWSPVYINDYAFVEDTPLTTWSPTGLYSTIWSTQMCFSFIIPLGHSF